MSLDLRAWYSQYAPTVHRRCAALLGDEALALEATRSVFAELARSGVAGEPRGASVWLLWTSARVCLDRLAAAPPEGSDPLARLARAPGPAPARGGWPGLRSRPPLDGRPLALLVLVDGLTPGRIAADTGLPLEEVVSALRGLEASLPELAAVPGSPSAVPEAWIERALLGEAEDAERDRVLADADAEDRLGRLPMRNARFLVAHPPEEVLPEVEALARSAPTPSRRGPGGAWQLAAALAILVLVGGGAAGWLAGAPAGNGPRAGAEASPPRGAGAKLRVYHRTADGVRRIAPGEVLRGGDRLLLGIVPGQARHAAVLSVDGRGGVSAHFPAAGASTALPPGPEIRLPDPVLLSDAPDFQRFVVVSGQEPIDPEAVRSALEALGAGPGARTGAARLPPGLEQAWFLVRKEER